VLHLGARARREKNVKAFLKVRRAAHTVLHALTQRYKAAALLQTTLSRVKNLPKDAHIPPCSNAQGYEMAFHPGPTENQRSKTLKFAKRISREIGQKLSLESKQQRSRLNGVQHSAPDIPTCPHKNGLQQVVR
jgi:hypothetical protein